MKKIILSAVLAGFVFIANAQLLNTVSTSSSIDGGNTFQLVTVDSNYHDATHCRPAYTYGWQYDNASQQLKRSSYQTIDYYDNGNVKQNVNQIWNQNSGAYMNYHRTTFTYFQSTSKGTSTLNETWNGIAWQNSTLQTNTYDANGNITGNLNQTWNTLSNTWAKIHETIYYNNNKGVPDSVIEQNYQNNLPAAKTKTIYTYGSASLLVLQEVSQNYVNNQWENSERSTNTYDANGRLTTTITETYSDDDQWEDPIRQTYVYTGGNITSVTTEISLGSSWLNVSRIIYTYYPNNKVHTLEFATFSLMTQSWTINGKSIYAYNTDGAPTEITNYAYSGTNGTATKLNFSYQLCTATPGTTPGELCPNGNTALTASLTGASYQWQVNTGGGFINIGNNSNYSGATTAKLNLSSIPTSWYGYQFRCVVAGQNSSVYTIKFVSKWTGATNNQWENGSNWSCGTVPDANTDVIINNGSNAILNSNRSVRSLSVSPGAKFTVNTGFKLTLTH